MMPKNVRRRIAASSKKSTPAKLLADPSFFLRSGCGDTTCSRPGST